MAVCGIFGVAGFLFDLGRPYNTLGTDGGTGPFLNWSFSAPRSQRPIVLSLTDS